MATIGMIYDQTSDWQQSKWERACKLVFEAKPSSQTARTGLDLGCGAGARTRQILNQFSQVERIVAIDSNQSMLDVARSKNADQRIDYRHLAMEDLAQLESSSYDLVFANYSLHWLENKNNLMNELNRLTRPGSLLVIGTCEELPTGLKSIDRELRSHFQLDACPSPFHYLNHAEWQELLTSFGWKMLAAKQTNDPHVITKSYSFLKQWWASSAGKAFYDLPFLDPDKERLIYQSLDKEFGSGDSWIFFESTLLLVAEKEGSPSSHNHAANP